MSDFEGGFSPERERVALEEQAMKLIEIFRGEHARQHELAVDGSALGLSPDSSASFSMEQWAATTPGVRGEELIFSVRSKVSPEQAGKMLHLGRSADGEHWLTLREIKIQTIQKGSREEYSAFYPGYNELAPYTIDEEGEVVGEQGPSFTNVEFPEPNLAQAVAMLKEIAVKLEKER